MVKVSRYRLVTRPFIVIFLKTRGKPAALKVSRSIAHKLDDFWVQIRGAVGQMRARIRLLAEVPADTPISASTA